MAMKSKQVYTVDDAIEKLGFGPFQMLIFFLCGFLWLADAMELMLLSILSPAVKCQWNLSSAEEAIITSVVFLGAMIGSVFWGAFGDSFGRKKGLLGMNVCVLVCGVLSAVQLTSNDDRLPGYPWLLLCRFGVGFGAAGITQVSTYYIEFLPRKTRAICTLFVSSWWAIGTMFGAGLAVGVMGPDKLGWHWYLGLSASPMAFAIVLIPFAPESARFYVVKGKKEQAVKVLKKIARLNSKSLPLGTLVSYEEVHVTQDQNEKAATFVPKTDQVVIKDSNEYGKSSVTANKGEKQPLLNASNKQLKVTFFQEMKSRVSTFITDFPLLFVNGMWKVTFILGVLWFGSAWLYYGTVLLTTTMFQLNPHCGINDTDAGNSTCVDHQLDTEDYLRIMWTAGAELPGLLVTVTIIEIVGRKLTMAFNFSIVLIGFCLLFLCTNELLLTAFLFLIRAFATGVFQTMYVYTPEVYPTKVRGAGMGLLYSVARIGAIITPYVAQVLFRASDYAAISLYAFSALVLIVQALLLPIETKGKSLRDGK
jgi:MFS family permease